jgi:hypothetical protein
MENLLEGEVRTLLRFSMVKENPVEVQKNGI